MLDLRTGAEGRNLMTRLRTRRGSLLGTVVLAAGLLAGGATTAHAAPSPARAFLDPVDGGTGNDTLTGGEGTTR